MDIYDVTLTLTEPMLGTVSLDKDLYTTFIQSKAECPNECADEIETLSLDAEIEKGTTGFHRLDGQPIVYDYVVKGFFKDACGMLRRDARSGSAKIKAYKKIIDGLIFIEPRRIPIELAGDMAFLERPLRAQTAQGERVALARSETVPEGSALSFSVLAMADVSDKLLREWFEYGALRGLGQWRNAGYGRFQYEMTKRA